MPYEPDFFFVVALAVGGGAATGSTFAESVVGGVSVFVDAEGLLDALGFGAEAGVAGLALAVGSGSSSSAVFAGSVVIC